MQRCKSSFNFCTWIPLKKISIAMKSAENMTERYWGEVTCFERIWLRGSYHIKYSAHQVGIIVKEVMATFLKDTFCDLIVALIGYPRRQNYLRAKINSTYPTVSTERWLFLGLFSSWIMEHGERVQEHITEKQPKLQSCTLWRQIHVLFQSI